jgi:hypothetical protein
MFFKKRERKRGNFGENRRKGERILVGFSGFRGPTRRRAISGSALNCEVSEFGAFARMRVGGIPGVGPGVARVEKSGDKIDDWSSTIGV